MHPNRAVTYITYDVRRYPVNERENNMAPNTNQKVAEQVHILVDTPPCSCKKTIPELCRIAHKVGDQFICDYCKRVILDF